MKDSLAAALSQPRIAGLDFLRAIAVLLVLLDHSGLGRVGPVVVIDGGFGVEMFFVLSGFLITRGLLHDVKVRGTICLGEFYRRRAVRLLPAFYAYLVLGMGALLIANLAVPWKAILASIFYVTNYYQAATGAQTHYLSHCWSLAVEEQFYLIWPILMIAVIYRRWNLTKTLLSSLLLLWLVRPLYIAFGAHDEYLYRALETRADQLLIGCLLAVALSYQRIREFFVQWTRPGTIVVLVLLVIASLSFLRETLVLKYVLGYSLEPMLVAALIPMLIVTAHGTSWGARLLNVWPMVVIGQVSYGMYLYHPFIIQPARHLLERLALPTGIAIMGSVLVLFTISWISFRYFEDPLRRRWRSAKIAAEQPTTAAA